MGGTDPGSNPGLDYDNLNLEYFDGAAWQPVVAGQVTLPAGTTTLDVRVATFDDTELEGDETFELTATEIVAGSLAVPSATATGTILNDDIPPTRPDGDRNSSESQASQPAPLADKQLRLDTIQDRTLRVDAVSSLPSRTIANRAEPTLTSHQVDDVDDFFARFFR